MAEEAEPDVASWVEVQVTSVFTAATMVVFLVVFEFSRRTYAVATVFDRRRATKPNRTPPPLIRARYFEWLFLNTDPAYLEYSDMAHTREVIQERKRQQQSQTGKGPSLLDRISLFSTRGTNDRHDESHKRKTKNDFKAVKQVSFSSLETTLHKNDGTRKNSLETLDEEAVEPPKKNRFTLGKRKKKTETGKSGEESSSESGDDSDDPQQLAALVTEDNGGMEMVPTNLTTEYQKRGYRNKKMSKAAQVLTPDVVVVNGRRLPSSIAEYAIAGDLSEQQLDRYAELLLERERSEEEAFRERQLELKRKKKRNRRGAATPDEGKSLSLPAPSRLGYVGVRQVSERSMDGIISRFFPQNDESETEDDIDKNPNTNQSSSSEVDFSTGHYVNRHLKSTVASGKRPLSISDQELLRCIGLDAYVMIRFLRFGFDTSFYPFLAACLFLFPTYYNSPYEGELGGDDGGEAIVTDGYFQFTMNRLAPGSVRLWIAFGFSIVFFLFILRRLWVEWETFIELRFNFLANGDVEADEGGYGMTYGQNSVKEKIRRQNSLAPKDDVQLHLEQYRNSCMVEFIPESHRRDKELFEFFNAVFPNQVKRAEILLNGTWLSHLIGERQKFIVKYENIYAKQFHAKQEYKKKMDLMHEENVACCSYLFCQCCGAPPQQPTDPQVKMDGRKCCGKKMVKALPYYLAEIKRLNRQIEEEHRRLMIEKQETEDKDYSSSVFASTLEQGLNFVKGTVGELRCSTGFVEFKNLTSKQSALQCNITGTTAYMVTTSAPDPRDIIWENATVELAGIKLKHSQFNALLFTGTLFWSAVVVTTTSISNLDKLSQVLPGWMIPEQGTFWYGLIQGYLPVVILELLMLLIPVILKFIGKKLIRFKSNSELDNFVFVWHFSYRVANLLIIILSGSLLNTFEDITNSPRTAINKLASGISQQSQFFLNNMIVAAGSENLWELAQMPNMILHFLIHQVVTLEAKSKRALEKLEEAKAFEWGTVVPPFIFAFMVGTVYCTMVPIVIGVCAIFFYLATKVYTHQALYVYAQPYEGGGKLMYLLNKSIFIILHISITIFGTVLGLREAPIMGPTFLIVMNLVTFVVGQRVYKTFEEPSITLALTNARIIDEENERKAERMRAYEKYKEDKKEKRRQAIKAANQNSKRFALPSVAEEEPAAGDPKEKSSGDGSYLPTSLTASASGAASASKTVQFKNITSSSEQQKLTQRHVAKAAEKVKAEQQIKNEYDAAMDFFLYRQPSLNKDLWETKPRPYRD